MLVEHFRERELDDEGVEEREEGREEEGPRIARPLVTNWSVMMMMMIMMRSRKMEMIMMMVKMMMARMKGRGEDCKARQGHWSVMMMS